MCVFVRICVCVTRVWDSCLWAGAVGSRRPVRSLPRGGSSSSSSRNPSIDRAVAALFGLRAAPRSGEESILRQCATTQGRKGFVPKWEQRGAQQASQQERRGAERGLKFNPYRGTGLDLLLSFFQRRYLMSVTPVIPLSLAQLSFISRLLGPRQCLLQSEISNYI